MITKTDKCNFIGCSLKIPNCINKKLVHKNDANKLGGTVSHKSDLTLWLGNGVVSCKCCTVGSQADICENFLFQNLTVCVDTCISDLSFPKIAVLQVL